MRSAALAAGAARRLARPCGGRTLEASVGRRRALLRVPRPSRAAARDRRRQLVAADRLNWFDRVSKASAWPRSRRSAALELAGRYAKAKKPEIAESCERVFAGDFIVEVEVKEAALAWVPEPMRFAPAPVPAAPEAPEADIGGDGDAVDGAGQTGEDGVDAPAVEQIEEAA